MLPWHAVAMLSPVMVCTVDQARAKSATRTDTWQFHPPASPGGSRRRVSTMRPDPTGLGLKLCLELTVQALLQSRQCHDEQHLFFFGLPPSQ